MGFAYFKKVLDKPGKRKSQADSGSDDDEEEPQKDTPSKRKRSEEDSDTPSKRKRADPGRSHSCSGASCHPCGGGAGEVQTLHAAAAQVLCREEPGSESGDRCDQELLCQGGEEETFRQC